jgi:hypothetical protein
VQIVAFVWFALPWGQSFVWWIGSNNFFTQIGVFDAVEPVGLYEQTVVPMPADVDAKW